MYIVQYEKSNDVLKDPIQVVTDAGVDPGEARLGATNPERDQPDQIVTIAVQQHERTSGIALDDPTKS